MKGEFNKMSNAVIDKINDIYRDSGVAHEFLFTGNVQDFQQLPMTGGGMCMMRFPDMLMEYYAKRFKLIAKYDLHEWTYQKEGMKELAANLVRVSNASEGRNTQQNLMAVAANQQQQSSGPIPTSPSMALRTVERLLKGRLTETSTEREEEIVKCMFIFDFSEAYLSSPRWGVLNDIDANIVRILRWAIDSDIRRDEHLIIFLAQDRTVLHPALLEPENGIEKMEVHYPSTEDRAIFIKTWRDFQIEQGYSKNDSFVANMDENDIARSTAGLNFKQTEDLLLHAHATNQLTRKYIKQRKDVIIKESFNDVASIVEPTMGWGERVGGMNYMKRIFWENVVEPLLNNDKSRCAMGILMAGPPGVGKSMIAEALAYEANMLMLRVSMSRIFNMYLGSSERNLEKLFNLAVSIGCILLIDEIDQALPGRGGFHDGGSGGDTSSRVSGRILEFLGDDSHRGDVVVFGATNRPDLMDAALKRAGRFDKKIAILPPAPDAREEIFKVLFKKHGVADDSLWKKVKYREALDSLIASTDNWVPADMEEIVRKVRILSGDKTPTVDNIRFAQDVIMPTVQPDDIKFMTGLAMMEVNDLSTLPESMQGDRDTLIKQAKKRKAREPMGFRAPRARSGEQD